MGAITDNIVSDQLVKWLDALYQLADRLATLSTAALALTVTFRKDLAGNSPEFIRVLVLKTAWVAFILSVVGFVIIYIGRIDIHKRAVKAARIESTHLLVILPPWYFRVGRILLLAGFLGGLMLLASIGLIGW